MKNGDVNSLLLKKKDIAVNSKKRMQKIIQIYQNINLLETLFTIMNY